MAEITLANGSRVEMRDEDIAAVERFARDNEYSVNQVIERTLAGEWVQPRITARLFKWQIFWVVLFAALVAVWMVK